MNDTQQTIDQLVSLSKQLRDQAIDLTGKADVIDLAVSQLQGTLKTQLAELEDAKLRIQEMIDAAPALDTQTVNPPTMSTIPS